MRARARASPVHRAHRVFTRTALEESCRYTVAAATAAADRARGTSTSALCGDGASQSVTKLSREAVAALIPPRSTSRHVTSSRHVSSISAFGDREFRQLSLRRGRLYESNGTDGGAAEAVGPRAQRIPCGAAHRALRRRRRPPYPEPGFKRARLSSPEYMAPDPHTVPVDTRLHVARPCPAARWSKFSSLAIALPD